MRPALEVLQNANDEERKHLEVVAQIVALARSLEERVGELEDVLEN